MLKEPLFFDNPFRGKVPVETVNTDHLEYVVKDLVQKGEFSRTRFQFSYANGEAVPYITILNEVYALLEDRKGSPYAPIKADIAAKMGAAMKNVAKGMAETEAKAFYGVQDKAKEFVPIWRDPAEASKFWTSYQKNKPKPVPAPKAVSEVKWVPQRVASTGRFLIPERRTRWWLVAAIVGIGVTVAMTAGGCL